MRRPARSFPVAPILALAAACLAGGQACGQPTSTLDRIEINGVKSVDVSALRAALKEKPGDHVTVENIDADHRRLLAALELRHVTGGVKTSMRQKDNGHIDIIFDVNDNGVRTPATTTLVRLANPTLAHIGFTGNHFMATDDVAEAAALEPGEEATKEALAEAEARIKAAYATALAVAGKAANVSVLLQVTNAKTPGQVDLLWKITEADLHNNKAGPVAGYHPH